MLITASLLSCRKRNNEFSFAGVWEITKVEQVKYENQVKTSDITLSGDTLGWFAFQNSTGPSGQGKIQINFSSFSGMTTDYKTFWELSEHEADRLTINKRFYTRERFLGGEKWTWTTNSNNGLNYNRETIFVKHR